MGRAGTGAMLARVGEGAGVQVVWFKRDLRVRDHAPLAEAALRGPVLPLYVAEPGLARQPDFAPRHWTFIRESLRELRVALAGLGQPLIVRTGEVVATLEALRAVAPIAGLWAHEETGTAWTYARDRAVRDWARERGIPFTELPQSGVVRRLPGRDRWPALWQARMRAPLLPPPAALPRLDGIASGAIPTGQALGLPPDTGAQAQAGGETAGLALLDSFLAGRGAGYAAGMSSPLTAPDACSRLSPHLAWGTVSLRRAAQGGRARLAAERARGSADGDWARGLRAFESRLRWHCHFIQKLEDEGRLERESLIAPLDALRRAPLPGCDGPDAGERLAAWRAGATGYPLVDACMRSLTATGWLPFRMRALLVSFAAHDLWLPWQRFHGFLARQWLDYEPGIHLCQLQMQSGLTSLGALRIYNPSKQGYDHDPAGVFVRRWLPELRGVPDAFVHAPWLLSPERQAGAGCVIGRHYPAPIVDHEAATAAAKAAIGEARKRPEVVAAFHAARLRHNAGEDERDTRRRSARRRGVDGRQLALF